MAEDSATSRPVNVRDLKRRLSAMVGVDHLNPNVPEGEISGLMVQERCRQERVHQDVDTLLLFDVEFPFTGRGRRISV